MGRLCYPTQAPGIPRTRDWYFSQKNVTVQDLYCGQVRASTAVASAKAGVRVQEPLQSCLEFRSKSKKHDDLSRFFNKKAGNNLPILSVLAEGVFLFRIYQVIQFNYFTAIFFVIIQHFVNFSFIITRNTI